MSGRFGVLADLDGASGVRNPRECYPNFPEYQEFGVPNMVADVNASVEGLAAGGAKEIVVLDGHLIGENLRSGEISAPAKLSRGTLAEEIARGGLDGVFLVGLHGKTGTPNSFSSHTIAPFVAARYNGDVISDGLLVAYLAGAHGVPLVGASGDWVACEELTWILPELPVAPTKTGFDRSSVRHHNPEESRTLLRQVAARAAALKPAKVLSPARAFRLELSFADERDAEAACLAVDGLARRTRRVLMYTGDRFDEAMEFVARAVGSLYPGWVDGLGRRALPPEPAGRTAGGLLDSSVIERFYATNLPYWSD